MIKSINLLGNLAEFALKNRFDKALVGKEEEEILAFSKDHYSPLFFQRVAYRLQQRHIDCIAVDSVLAGLSPVFRQIIYLKYAEKMQMTKISLECGLSVPRIVSLDHDVREEIRDMLLYKLAVRDVYNRLKVANMVHILDLRLGFLEQFPEFAAVSSRDWVYALEVCREKYRNLYTTIEDVMRNRYNSLHCNILAAKLQQPNCTLKELSKMCHVSQSGICRHLQTFESEVAGYLTA